MRTQFDAINILYAKINTSPLKVAVNGAIYKLKRPTSAKEDIVINSIVLGSSNFQEGVFNVNIYVPNITVSGASLPNTARLNELETLGNSLFEHVTTQDYSIYKESTSLFEEVSINQHYINFRINFKSLG
jgi:hypothetical protein